MKKLLPILLVLLSLGARAQIILPPLGCPSCQLEIQGIHQDDSLYLMPFRNDTLLHPARGGGLVYAYGNAWLWTGSPLRWTLIAGISFGTIPGNVTAQTNLYDTILARQMAMVPGYGWKILNGNQGVFDSAVVRKVDSMYKINDSTIAFLINGHTYSFLFRGSAGGSVVSSISLNASPLFTGPVNFNNASGNWSLVLGLQNQNPNTGLMGPSSGSPGLPTFRSLVTADLPTGIPNANLANSTIELLIDQAGLVPAYSVSSISLGNTLTLHLPWASAVASGPLTAANWVLFNGKVDSTTMSGDSVYEWRSGVRTYRYFIVGGGGGGISNLNGLIAAVQTFASGITGTSPNIVSAGSTHTFNIPIGTAGADTGTVTPEEITTWNGKISDSGFNVLNSSLSGVPIQKLVTGPLRFVLWDTAANNPGAITTKASRQKLSDSLNLLIAAKQAIISGNGFPYFTGPSITFYNGGAGTLYGVGSSGGTGIISLGTNLSMSGTTLNATGGGSDSGFNVLNAALSGVPLAKTLPSGSKRLILYDTARLNGNPGAMVTEAGLKKALDSVTNLSINLNVYRQGAPGDTAVSAVSGQLAIAAQRDSSGMGVHHTINPDFSWTWYGSVFGTSVQGMAPASGGGTTNYLRADGTWAAPSGGGGTPANPTAVVGLTAVNGSAATYMRSDAAPPIDQTISPTMSGAWIFSNTNTTFKNILPSATTTYSLGSTGAYWNNVYTNNLDVNNILPPSNLVIQLATGQLMETYINGVIKEELLSTGQKQLNGYGSGTFTGTPTFALNVDATGHLIEGTVGGGGGGVALIGPIDSAAGVANGMRINGSSIYAQSATTTVPGMVNIVDQSFKGSKSFVDTTYALNVQSHHITRVGDSIPVIPKRIWNEGTSITFGTGSYTDHPQGSGTNTWNLYVQLGFAYQLARNAGVVDSNQGKGGTTLVRVSVGDSSLIDRLPDLPHWNANYDVAIFIEEGTNDAKQGTITTTAFGNAVTQVTDTLIARGWPLNEIIWITAPYSGSVENALLPPYATAMKTACAAFPVTCVDVYTYEQNLHGYSAVFSDSLHPNNLGHYDIAQFVSQSTPWLWRTGSAQVNGNEVVQQGLTVGDIRPWPNKFNDPTSQYVVDFLGGDMLLNNIEIGNGGMANANSLPDSSSMFVVSPAPTSYSRGGSLAFNNLFGFHAGSTALLTGSTAHDIDAFGFQAAAAANTGGYIVAIGNGAAKSVTSGVDLVAVGNGSLNTCASCTNSVAVGFEALLDATASNNTAVGYLAGEGISSGSSNTIIGGSTAILTSTGGQNVVVGQGSFAANTSGSNSTVVGQNAGPSATGGNETFFGQGAGYHIGAGTSTVFFGFEAGYQNENGSTTASTNCSYCGAFGPVAQVTENNAISIGAHVGSLSWGRVGIDVDAPQAYLHLPTPDSRAGHAAMILGSYDTCTTISMSGTGSSMLLTFSRTRTDIPYQIGESVQVTGAVPSGYNGIWVVSLCTTTAVTLTGTGSGAQTSPGLITPYTYQTTGTPWTWNPYLDSVYLYNRAGNPMNVVMSNRSNYFTVPQYLDNLSGAPATGYQILVHRTDSSWDEIPVSAISGGSTAPFFVQTANGSAYTNSTSATALGGTGTGSGGGTTTIPSASLTAGKTIHVHGSFVYSTGATNTTFSIAPLQITATVITLPASQTNAVCIYDLDVVIITSGGSGTYVCTGTLTFPGQLTNSTVVLENTTGSSTTASINTSSGLDFQPYGLWGTASSSNSIQSIAGYIIKIQ